MRGGRRFPAGGRPAGKNGKIARVRVSAHLADKLDALRDARCPDEAVTALIELLGLTQKITRK